MWLMELRSKKRHKAFTLLETIIALVVTSIGLSLFMGFMLNLKSNLSSVRQDDLAQVEQLVSVLKTRGLSLEYKGTSFGNVVFYSPPRQANYQLNPRTMASKLCPGLFFAGEVLDVDAYTGGYNLQIAFCTAQAAARAF